MHLFLVVLGFLAYIGVVIAVLTLMPPDPPGTGNNWTEEERLAFRKKHNLKPGDKFRNPADVQYLKDFLG